MLGERPDTTGLRDPVRHRYRRQASEISGGTSDVENAVARYAMCSRPSASLTYSTKSVVVASRVSPCGDP